MPVEKNVIQSDQEKPVKFHQEELVKHEQEEPVQHAREKRVQHDQEEPVQHDQKEPVQHDQEEPVQHDQEVPVQHDQEVPVQQKRTIRSLINTPFKRVMFGIQILSYILILGSPAIGGLIGKMLELKTGATAGVILGIFIAGEILFYGSLAFLGKELILLLKERFRAAFRKKR